MCFTNQFRDCQHVIFSNVLAGILFKTLWYRYEDQSWSKLIGNKTGYEKETYCRFASLLKALLIGTLA